MGTCTKYEECFYAVKYLNPKENSTKEKQAKINLNFGLK